MDDELMNYPGIDQRTMVRGQQDGYSAYDASGYTTNPEAHMAMENPKTFGEAFRIAKDMGMKVFDWHGKKYTTETKEEQIAKQSMKVAGAAVSHANNLENRIVQNEGKVHDVNKGEFDMFQTFGITPPSENAMGSRQRGSIRQVQFGGPDTRFARLLESIKGLF